MSIERRNELTTELENLETREFMIYMCDHWTVEDKNNLNKIQLRIAEIKNLIN